MNTMAIRIARGLVWFVYAWVVVTMVLLFLAFVLQLFGANPEAGFVEWVYRSVERAMAPFRGIFEAVEITDRSVLDVSLLFAMVVYMFVALGLNTAVDWISRRLHQAEISDRHRADMQAQVAASAAPIGAARILQLTAPSGASLSAVLTPYPWGTGITLDGAGLDLGRAYTAWFEAARGGRVEAATFRPESDGTVTVAVNSPVVLADSVRFGLAQSPGPGDPAVTDLLTANLR